MLRRSSSLLRLFLVFLTATSALSLFGTATAPSASAADPNTDPVTVWVDGTNGNDAYFCLQAHPCKSLALAMIAVGNRWGSTVMMAPGRYSGQFVLDGAINLVGTGSSPDDVVIVPDIKAPVHTTYPVFTVFDSLRVAMRVRFENLTISDSNGQGGIDGDGAMTLSHVVVKNNVGAEGAGLNYHGVDVGSLSIDHSVFSGNSSTNSGGALTIQGNATITDSTFSGNHSANYGGAIQASYGSNVDIARTSFVANTAHGVGGAISMFESRLHLRNSTVANNQGSGGYGSGIALDGTTATLVNDTISGNGPPAGAPAQTGGGLALSDYEPSAVTITNSIIAGNHATSESDCSNKYGGTVHDGGNNVIGDNSSCPEFRNEINNTVAGTRAAPLDAQLQPLDAVGGVGPMLAINTFSPAFGRADGATCTTVLGDVDQRGLSRSSGARGVCDSGAYDTGSFRAPSPSEVSAFPKTTGVTVAWDAPPNYLTPITGYTITCLPGCGTQTVAANVRFLDWSPVAVGRQYSFTVAALTSDGPGSPSLPTAPVTALAPPGLPRNVVATAVGTTVDVSWDPPLDAGSVSSYVVLCYPNMTLNDPTGVPTSCTAHDGFRPGLLSPMTTHLRLTNAPVGIATQFGILAQNVVGTSAEARSQVVNIAIAPGTPTVALDPADDTGAARDDAITTTRVLHLGGTADAGSVVSIKDRGQTIGVAMADAEGNWTATTPQLVDGAHPLTASTTRSMITSTSTPINAVIDNSTPSTPGVLASVHLATATVTWTPAASAGPVGYFVTMNPGGLQKYVAAGQPLTTSFDNLLPSTTYSFVVAPISLAGIPGGAGLSDNVTTKPAPTVTHVSVHQGTSAGGKKVVVKGTDLAGVTEVRFGSSRSQDVVVAPSGKSLTVITPAGSGAVDVQVVNPLGISPTSQVTRYTYVAPKVTSVTPKRAPVNTQVTIKGTNFGRVTSVRFGGVAAHFHVETNSKIVVTAPPGLPPNTAVDVIVSDAGASSAAKPVARFTCIP